MVKSAPLYPNVWPWREPPLRDQTLVDVCLRSIEASWSSCNALHWPEDWFDLISGALNVVPWCCWLEEDTNANSSKLRFDFSELLQPEKWYCWMISQHAWCDDDRWKYFYLEVASYCLLSKERIQNLSWRRPNKNSQHYQILFDSCQPLLSASTSIIKKNLRMPWTVTKNNSTLLLFCRTSARSGKWPE